jgi:hypothetical protein
MAEAIRALPATKDWELPAAHQWWREFRAEESAAHSGSGLTITVDLGGRGEIRT